jgi:N-acetylglucosamine-6-phosphate deacetylase
MSRFVISARRVATPSELLQDAFVAVEGATVREVGRGRPPASAGPVVQLGDVIVAPGFVDLHVHGGGGHDVNRSTPDECARAARRVAAFHARHGTTSLVATTVSDTHEVLLSAVQGIAEVAEEAGSGVLGTNLEGPFISRVRAGAQYPSALRSPSEREFSQLLERARGTLRLITVAPELPGALQVLRAAASAGVVAAIGHTDADYPTSIAAFDAGARHVTHLFNAMPPLHHRRPGPAGAALADPRVSVEVVSDGAHVHPAVIALVASLVAERLVLVTDAIGPAGAPPGRYHLGPIEVLVSEERSVLADGSGTVAGSVLTMDKAVGFAVNKAGVPLLTALQAASLNPASVLGEKSKGRLAPGADADLVVLDANLRALATVIAGRAVYDPGGLLRSVGATA